MLYGLRPSGQCAIDTVDTQTRDPRTDTDTESDDESDGGADEEGSILVGDVITAVDGEPCLDTAGLDTGAVASLRRLHGRPGSTDTCVAAPSAQGSSAAETGSIVSLEQLQSRLRGLAASHVRIRVARCGGWRQYEVEVRRKVLPSLAASYM